ncbi:MAG TPA: hypothetical protein VJS92_07770, partial [Candidatus Polarisedimenticolaceae bacterium]|nr:hypothetical protein [Candidatus Polarisedimenticolaceae bacterium]
AALRPRAVPLGQLRDSYLLAEDEDGLVVVDQHAAHERVLFERLMAAAERDEVEVQQLLFPPSFELPAADVVRLEEELAELRRLGLHVEPFGPSTVRVHAVPAVAAGEDPERLVRELFGEAARARAAAVELPELRRRLVTTAACQAAIKVHHALALPAMQALLDDLFRTGNPTTCPHGRPVLFRMSLEEIERAFRRR